MRKRKEEKETTPVVLHKHSLWKRLKDIGAQTFPYPIVYEDGLVTRRQWYAIKRSGEYAKYKAFGIVFKGYILKLDSPDALMDHDTAAAYCQTEKFAGISGQLPPSELMQQIVENYNKLHYMLDVIGASRISDGDYLTSTPGGMEPSGEPLRYAWHFCYTLPSAPIPLLKEEKGKVLVVFKVK